MKNLFALIFIAILLNSCSGDIPYDETDFNLFSGKGRTNSYEQFGNFPLQLMTEEIIISDDSSGAVQAALRLKSPYSVVATAKGNVLRINNNSADKYFNIDSSFVVATGMATDRNSNIYFINSDDNLYSINFDFNLNWKIALPIKKSRALSYSDLLVTDDGIIIGANSGELFFYDYDGKIKWKFKSSLAVGKTFAADSSGNLYIPFSNNTFGESDSLICFDKSGKILWQNELPATRILSSSVYHRGKVYVSGATDKNNERFGTTFCFDKSGKLVWSAESTLPVRNISIDYEGNCYLTSTSFGVGEISTGVLKYDIDGKEEWKVYFGAAATSPLVISKKYLAFTAFTGEGAALFFVRKSDGMLVRNHSLSNMPPLYLQPLVADDASIKLFGSHKLKLVKFTETSLNKLLP